MVWKIGWKLCGKYGLEKCTVQSVECRVYSVQCTVRCSSVVGGSPSVPQFGEWKHLPGSCLASPLQKTLLNSCRGPQKGVKFGPQNGVKCGCWVSQTE